jgi:hypothetical protein
VVDIDVRISWLCMRRKIMLTAVSLACIGAAGCGFVDSSFDSRIGTINGGFGSASNTEILANIVRASSFEPLRFYLHSKFVPSQTSDVKVGLPTITFGPGQTLAQKQFVFAANGTDNSASLSLEVDPIETRDFHNTLITPVSPGTIGLLVQNFPREIVFLLLFDSVDFQASGDTQIEYKNDPTINSLDCREYHYDGSSRDANYDPDYSLAPNDPNFAGVPTDLSRANPYRPPGIGEYADLRRCPYDRFRYWIANAIAYGLTFDFEDAPNPKHNPNDPKDTSPPTIVKGNACFNPALAQKSLAPIVATFDTLCSSARPPSATGKKVLLTSNPVAFPFPYQGANGKQITADVRLRPRSLYGVYTYLGKLLSRASRQSVFVPVYTDEARSNGDLALLTAVYGSSQTASQQYLGTVFPRQEPTILTVSSR